MSRRTELECHAGMELGQKATLDCYVQPSQLDVAGSTPCAGVAFPYLNNPSSELRAARLHFLLE